MHYISMKQITFYDGRSGCIYTVNGITIPEGRTGATVEFGINDNGRESTVTEMVMGRVTDYNELISAAYQKLKARLVVLGQLSAEMKLPSSDREKPAA